MACDTRSMLCLAFTTAVACSASAPRGAMAPDGSSSFGGAMSGGGAGGVSGAGGATVAGGSGGTGPKAGSTSVAAGKRRTVPGDEEWPQLAYSPDNSGATTGRLSDSPQLSFDVRVDGEIAYTMPVVGEGKLFYQLYPGGVVALAAGTGKLIWQNKNVGAGKYGTAAYAEGRVFSVAFGGSGFDVVALDAGTGTELWRSPATLVGIIKVDQGTVYLSDGHVVALDAATGAIRWTSLDECRSPPAVDGNRVYCVGLGQLLALDAATGQRIYAAPAASTESTSYSAPALDDGRLFFIGSRLYAHSTADGTPLWDADFGAFSQAALGNLTQTFPSVAYGKVVVVGARGVAAFDAGTGAPVWQSGQSEPGSCVAIADGRVVTSGGILLDVDTGAVLWQPATTISTWSPIVTDGHFYAGSLNGHIYGWGGAVPGEPPSY